MSISDWPIKPPSRSSCTPLYLQLAGAFVEYIRENNIPPNTPIPSESDLMEEYGLSRITVRQAMIKLCSEGWVNKKQGKGTFTALPSLRPERQELCLPDGSPWYEPEGVEERLLDAVEYPPSLKYQQLFALGRQEGTFRVRLGKFANGSMVGVETRHFPPWVKNLYKDALLEGNYRELMSRHEETRSGRIHFNIRTTSALDYEVTCLGIPPEANMLTIVTTFYNRQDVPVMTGRVVYNTEQFSLEYDISYGE